MGNDIVRVDLTLGALTLDCIDAWLHWHLVALTLGCSDIWHTSHVTQNIFGFELWLMISNHWNNVCNYDFHWTPHQQTLLHQWPMRWPTGRHSQILQCHTGRFSHRPAGRCSLKARKLNKTCDALGWIHLHDASNPIFQRHGFVLHGNASLYWSAGKTGFVYIN